MISRKWVVVGGASGILFTFGGIYYSFGLILTDLYQSYGSGHGVTSSILSFMGGVSCCCGPISSSIANQFGCRTAVILGSIIAAIGSGLSYFATSIVFLIITVGFIMGFGFSLMFCPAIIIVNMYHKDQRALAVGIVVCGAGFGTFLFAPFTAYLLETYSWRGTFLIYSGLIANGVVFGALFREPEDADGDVPEMEPIIDTFDPNNDDTSTQIDHNNCIKVAGKDDVNKNNAINNLEMDNSVANGFHKSKDKSESSNIENVKFRSPNIDAIMMSNGQQNRCHSDICINGKKHSTDSSISKLAHISQARPRSKTVLHHALKPLERVDIFYSGLKVNDESHYYRNRHHRHFSTSRPVSGHEIGGNRPDFQRMISSLSADNHLDSDVSHRKWPTGTESHEESRRASNEQNMSQIEMFQANGLIRSPSEDRGSSFRKNIIKSLKSLTDLSLLKNPVFLTLALSTFLTNVGYDLPRIFLPDKAQQEFGIDKTSASWLLSIWGILNTVGRVAVGWVCDQEWALKHRLWIYNGSLCFAGVINMILPFCESYASLAVYAGLFGLSLSTYISLTSVVLVDLLGIERLTNAFGLSLFFQGLGALVGPPVGGLIVDETSSYNHSFIFAGICLFISGAMLMPVAYNRQKLSKQQT